jgi:hypothetical protein
MKNYTHNEETGKFCSPNPELLARKAISVRLPVSIDTRVRAVAGDQLSAWIRDAVAEKLEREDSLKSA